MSNSKNSKHSKKSREEMLDMTFGYIPDEEQEVEHKKSGNSVLKYLNENKWLFIFVCIMLIATLFVGKFETQHPIACTVKGTVKEIISIDRSYAQVRLTDGQIINYQISSRSTSRTGGTVYNATIKPEDEVCLQYARQ